MPEVARSAAATPHSRIRELADLAFQLDAAARAPSERVLKLYFGESNLPTPEFLKQAARRALDQGYTYYTENAGLLSLREEIAAYYQRAHGVRLDPAAEIVITASGVQALNVGIRCTLDPGDEAIILTPAWPNAASIVSMSNAHPRMVPLRLEGGRYAIDFDALEAAVTPRTRLLVYTSPSNPLGWAASVEDQQQLLQFSRRRGLWLLADEVYERLYYRSLSEGDPAPSILRLANRQDSVLVVQSFSKSYCMTGWRLGWLVARRDLAARAAVLNEFIVSHAASFVQKTGEVALRDGEEFIRQMLRQYSENRDVCLDRLRRIPGVQVPEPDGAFYLFPQIRDVRDSFDFCKRLLLESRVGLAPGAAFGPGGESSVRICYASSREILEEALSRFEHFLKERW